MKKEKFRVSNKNIRNPSPCFLLWEKTADRRGCPVNECRSWFPPLSTKLYDEQSYHDIRRSKFWESSHEPMPRFNQRIRPKKPKTRSAQWHNLSIPAKYEEHGTDKKFKRFVYNFPASNTLLVGCPADECRPASYSSVTFQRELFEMSQ